MAVFGGTSPLTSPLEAQYSSVTEFKSKQTALLKPMHCLFTGYEWAGMEKICLKKGF